MKLKYRYEVDTWAKDESGSLKSLAKHIENYDVEFLFDDEHKLTAINVLVPDAKVTYSTEGTVQPLDKSKDAKAHIIANYIVNVLQEETGKCDFRKLPETPEYVPEISQEEAELKGKKFTFSRSLSADAFIRGRFDFSENTLNKYIKQMDAFAIYSDAKRISNPVGKYREFFRVLEHFFPFEREEFDRKVSSHFIKYDNKYIGKYVNDLRQLRNRCSHAKKNYIISSDLAGMEQVKSKLHEIQKMAKLLIENPP